MENFKVLAVSILCCVVSAGCSGDNATPVTDDGAVQNDPPSCPVPEPDFAEQLFTEVDRQWFCSVTADNLVTDDQVYFTRDGQGVMTRFREVYWNRTLADQSLNVASPFISPFTIRNIRSSNTVLTFDLVNASGGVEAYDCVLVGRELTVPSTS